MYIKSKYNVDKDNLYVNNSLDNIDKLLNYVDNLCTIVNKFPT